MVLSITRFKLLLQIFGLLILLCGAAFAQERNMGNIHSRNRRLEHSRARRYAESIWCQRALDKKGSYSYSDETGFFAVVYENSPGWAVTIYKPFIGSHYKKIRKKFVKDSRGKLLKDEKFKNGDESGREFFVQIPDGKVLDNEGQWKSRYKIARFRVFFNGNRCYILMAVLPENEVYTSPINNYFTSFTANK